MSDMDIRYVGEPDGPVKFRPELGIEVGTYLTKKKGNRGHLMHHVPLNMRGPFRPDQLANYDVEKSYRVDRLGFAMCMATNSSNQEMCRNKAVNRYPRCETHGAAIHPYDKLVEETGDADADKPMSRYQLYLAKQITVEDLDDDELLGFGFKDEKTGKIFKPSKVPREMVTAFKRALFDRSLDKLKHSSLDAANTLVNIMLDPSIDATVRLRAATEILDRTIGKAPIQVNLKGSPAFEQVFEGLATLTRDESRAARGKVIDADFHEETPEDPTQGAIGA